MRSGEHYIPKQNIQGVTNALYSRLSQHKHDDSQAIPESMVLHVGEARVKAVSGHRNVIALGRPIFA